MEGGYQFLKILEKFNFCATATSTAEVEKATKLKKNHGLLAATTNQNIVAVERFEGLNGITTGAKCKQVIF